MLLADDRKIVREDLRSLLSDEAGIEIVGEAAHGRAAVDLALRPAPDVVIRDVSMPLIDSDVATREVKEHTPKTRVIALSTYNEPETMEKMYRAGAEGYVLKTASSEEWLAALRGPESDSQWHPAWITLREPTAEAEGIRCSDGRGVVAVPGNSDRHTGVRERYPVKGGRRRKEIPPPFACCCRRRRGTRSR